MFLRTMAAIVGVLITLAWFAGSLAVAAEPEVRGTKFSTTGPDHIRTGVNTEVVTNDLRNIGINSLYVETWKNGYTNFPSPTLATFTGGIDRNTPVIGATRDLVQETLINAHRNQMHYVGWFEYGFASQFLGSTGNPSNPLSNTMKNQGWLLQDQAGKYSNTTNEFAWMNPAVPQVRQFLIDVTLEAVNRYDLDVVEFSDRLAWPREFGWDTTTAGLYLAETGRSLPTSIHDAQFRTWRQEKVTLFANELFQAVKTARPEVQVSVSPSITGFSETNYNINWTPWVDQGLFDHFVPQAYRDSIAGFNSIIDAQVAPFEPDDLDKLVVGIRINGSGPTTPYADVEQMIERTRAEGAAGHNLWYSNGVRELYAAELTAFYDVAGQGHAPSPHFPVDHRPAPLVAASVGSSTWNANVTTEGRYRIVAKINNLWTEHSVAHLAPGMFLLQVPNASQVELLVDRRSATSFLGDFDGDNDVDGRDFLAWQAGFGMTSGATATDGDANYDGKVNQLDLARWQLNYGWRELDSLSGRISVAEPASASLLLVLMAIMGAKRRLRGEAIQPIPKPSVESVGGFEGQQEPAH